MLRVAMSLLGSLPPMIGFGLDPADALFGSISAVTAGEAVVVGLDDLPQSLLFRTACPVDHAKPTQALAERLLSAREIRFGEELRLPKTPGQHGIRHSTENGS